MHHLQWRHNVLECGSTLCRDVEYIYIAISRPMSKARELQLVHV